MPILPATATMEVRLILDSRFFSESMNAIPNDIEDFFFLPLLVFCSGSSAGAEGSSSSLPSKRSSFMTSPSFKSIIRVEYSFASSGLCVTIMTRRSFEISFKSSIICTLVTESSAPVGSSASTISGSLISARAIATLCA